MLKEHPSRPVPSCGLPPQPSVHRECGPGDREQQPQVSSGCLEGGAFFIQVTVPPSVARGLPPVTVLPLNDVKRMLQEWEAEDGTPQSRAVDRLGAHQPFHFDAMD